MKWAILFLFLLVIIPLVMAQENTDTYQQASIIELKHPVRIGGGLPNAATNCNISISYPTTYPANNTLLVNFKAMGRDGNSSYFNYTLNQSQTTFKGLYNYDVTCISGTLNQTDSFQFLINYGGVEPTQERTDSISRSIYFIFIIGIAIFLAFLFNKNSGFPIRATTFLLALLFFLIGIDLLFLDLQDQVVNPRLEGFFSSFTNISFIMYWGIAVMVFTIWIITFIVNIMQNQMHSRMQQFEDTGE